MSASGGKIRQATADDFEGLYPLLQELNNTRITREVWQRLFEPLWREEDFCVGYVIEDGDALVGFIGTLYCERLVEGEPRRFCNLTSWIVLPEYRQQSVMLLMPFLRDKTLTLTSLTSSVEAYAVYQKLGFKDLETGARVIYRWPSLSSGRYRLFCGQEVLALLDTAQRKLYQDHDGLDLIHCVVERGEQRCYLVLEVKRQRAYLQFASAPQWLRGNLAGFRGKLLSTLGVKTLQVDERYLSGIPIFLSRHKLFEQARQYRGAEIDHAAVDGMYSELVVLATRPPA